MRELADVLEGAARIAFLAREQRAQGRQADLVAAEPRVEDIAQLFEAVLSDIN